MDKHAIRIEINNLLDQHCHGCKLVEGHSSLSQNVIKICQTCPHYKKIRQLGDMLLIKEDKKKMPKPLMTIDQYKGFVAEGLDALSIANRLGTSKKAVYAWKYNHKDEIEKSGIEPKKVKKVKKSAENEPKQVKDVYPVLSEKEVDVTSEQAKAYKEMKTKYLANIGSLTDELEKYKEDLNAYKTMVEERSKRMNEALQAKSQLIVRLDEVQKELLIANDKYERETRANYSLCQEIEKLSKAFTDANSNYNAKCKQVEDLNAAADDLEAEIIGLRNDKTDLEHQLAYTGQERDRFFNLYNQSNKQLKALEAYVLTRLEPEK